MVIRVRIPVTVLIPENLNPATDQVVDIVSLDGDPINTACSWRVKHNARRNIKVVEAIKTIRGSFDIVDVEVTNGDTEIGVCVSDFYEHATPTRFRGRVVGDLNVLDCPVALVYQIHCPFRLPIAINDWQRACAIFVDRDRTAACA